MRRRVWQLAIFSIVLVAVPLGLLLGGRRAAIPTFGSADLPRVALAGTREGSRVRVVLSTPFVLRGAGRVREYVPGPHPLYPPTIVLEFPSGASVPDAPRSVVGVLSFRLDLRRRLSRVPGVAVLTDCEAE